MKKIIAMIMSVFILIVFTACGEKPASESGEKRTSKFHIGDVVVSSLGESYTQLFTANNEMTGDSAEIISHRIEAIKMLDITNAEDYFSGEKYFQYLYTATVVGKVNAKYAGKAIYIYTQYPINVQTEVVNDYKNGALISEDGSFTLTYNVYCNEPLETFYPYWIQIES